MNPKSRTRKRWAIERERGYVHMRDAAAVRVHISALGMSNGEVARRTGLSSRTIDGIMNGRARRVYAVTARRVLALQPLNGPPKLPQIGVQRRLGALLRMRWSHREIEARGVDSTNLLYTKGQVTRATHEKVDALYRELCMRTGPSPQSATWAVRAGYAPPLAWDEDTIDDPGAIPYFGKSRKQNLREEFYFLLSCGESEEQALKQLGVSPSALEKWKQRAA